MNIREKLEALDLLDRAPDRNVETVRQMLLDRSRVGLTKYGVTTERGDLTRVQWLRHAQEEALDLAVYLERLISAEAPTVWICSCSHPDLAVPIGQACPICKP